MSRPSKGARLWLRPERRDGARVRPAVWLIRDGNHEESTGCGAGDRRGAEEALARYIASKYAPERTGSRNPAAVVPVADALTIYLQDVAPSHARPRDTAQRVKALLGFFGDKMLSSINSGLCRAYVAARGHRAAARRELEDLRSAINHHRCEGLCSELVEVILPERPPRRERWLTRNEAARLLWAAWRARQMDANAKGAATRRAVEKKLSRDSLSSVSWPLIERNRTETLSGGRKQKRSKIETE